MRKIILDMVEGLTAALSGKAPSGDYATNAGVASAIASAIAALPAAALTKSYASANTAMVASTPITFTHGLTMIPKIVILEVVCKTAELGYAVGDVVDQTAMSVTSGNSASSIFVHGISCYKTATQIIVQPGTSLNAPNKAGIYIGTYLTIANWDLRVRAFA